MIDNDKIVLTGIKPTGTPHLGNYIGALKPLVEMSNKHKTGFFENISVYQRRKYKDCASWRK